jgi:hypothetical protein
MFFTSPSKVLIVLLCEVLWLGYRISFQIFRNIFACVSGCANVGCILRLYSDLPLNLG